MIHRTLHRATGTPPLTCGFAPESPGRGIVNRGKLISVHVAGCIRWHIEIDHGLRDTHLPPYSRLLDPRIGDRRRPPFPIVSPARRLVRVRIEAPSCNSSSEGVFAYPLVQLRLNQFHVQRSSISVMLESFLDGIRPVFGSLFILDRDVLIKH